MPDPRTPVQVPAPATIPIWPLNPDGSCSCGRMGCDAAGKHPRHKGGPLDGGGYGILCGASGPKGSGIFVVDCDVRGDINGLENFHRLCVANGGLDIPDTLVGATGGGGIHLYFLHPGYPIKNSKGSDRSGLIKGVDIKGDGGWVVGPGSPHLSGRAYRIIRDVPIAQAPDWLLSWPGLRKTVIDGAQPGDFAPVPIQPDHPDWDRRVEAFRSECRGDTGTILPSIDGSYGSNPLFYAAKQGTCYYLLPPEVVVRILDEDFNPRCFNLKGEPAPWDLDDIWHKVSDAIDTNIKLTPGPPPEDWGDRLRRRIMAGDATIDPTTGELRVLASRLDDVHAEHCSCGGGDVHRYKYAVGESITSNQCRSALSSEILFKLTRDEDWVGCLQWDEFADGVRAIQPPIRLDAETGALSEADYTAIKVWFEVAKGIKMEIEQLRQCVHAAAKQVRVHPVKDYLKSLPMGDPTILDNLASVWFGATDPLSNHLLKMFLVGAVRRILWPGTQMDTMLILYGPLQGEGKSQWIASLFGRQWMNRQMPKLDDKDASQQMGTCWAQEIGELDALLKVKASTSKDFISRDFDSYRKPYGRDVIRKLRQCVLIGTTNIREFLRDPTGERRYWIIQILWDINQDLVRSMRDQVWAAAVALAFDPSFKHYLERGEPMDVALRARHAEYQDQHPWHDQVLEYCYGRPWVRGEDVFKYAIMRGDPDWIQRWKRQEQSDIGDILRSLGATKGVVRDPADKTRTIKVYKLPDQVAKTQPSEAERARRFQAKEPLVALDGGKEGTGDE